MADLFPTFRRVPSRLWLVICVAAVLLCASLISFPLYYPHQQYDTADLEKAAIKGDATSQFYLALSYAHGKDGAKPDFASAAHWYEKSAAQGFAKAQNNLGVMYLSGEGVPQDTAKAEELYERAANQGFAIAQENLGDLYLNGIHRNKDAHKSFVWYKKAAVQGNVDSQAALGYLYHSGEGIKQDFVEARAWFEKAAESGNDYALIQLGIMHELGEGVTIDLDRAATYYEKAAKTGNVTAQENLGNLYTRQEKDAEKIGKGLFWLNQAAEKNSARALYSLGRIHQDGKGVPANNSKATFYYEQAAELGEGRAMSSLCGIYYEQRESAQAISWCEKASTLNEVTNIHILAFYHLNGIGTKKDWLKAGAYLKLGMEDQDLYSKRVLLPAIENCREAKPDEQGYFSNIIVKSCLLSAGADNNIALYNASLIYAKGYPDLGIPQDTVKAAELRMKAFSAGYKPDGAKEARP